MAGFLEGPLCTLNKHGINIEQRVLMFMCIPLYIIARVDLHKCHDEKGVLWCRPAKCCGHVPISLLLLIMTLTKNFRAWPNFAWNNLTVPHTLSAIASSSSLLHTQWSGFVVWWPDNTQWWLYRWRLFPNDYLCTPARLARTDLLYPNPPIKTKISNFERHSSYLVRLTAVAS